MPAKKKRTTVKKPTKKFHKPKEPKEEKGGSQEETTPAEPQTTDTVIASPQANTDTQPDSTSPQQPLSPNPPDQSAPTPQVTVTPPETAGAIPQPASQPQTSTPQIISTTGQVLPASGVPAQPAGEFPPQVPPVAAIPEAPGTNQPSAFQLDDTDTGNKKNIILMILLILGIAALIGIGFVYRSAIMGLFAGKTVSPTPTPAPVAREVTPTKPAETAAKLDAYNITVLNGSGRAGEASKVKDLLAEKGYKVGTAGNAETSDFEGTVIKAKSSVERKFLDSLKKLLSETYELDPVDSLSETEDVDIVITIGKNKKDQ